MDSAGTAWARELMFYFRDNWLAIAAFLLSIISLAITLWKNVKDRSHANDKELLEQLKQSLRLAYEALATQSQGATNIPIRWLNSARHILRYRQLKRYLKTKLYKTICEEQEEYWSERFYALLQRIDNSRFFECINTDEMEEEHIEPRAAAIVYSISVWPKGRPDPLDDQSFEEIVAHYNLFSPLHRHFREYIKGKHPKLATKVVRSTSDDDDQMTDQ